MKIHSKSVYWLDAFAIVTGKELIKDNPRNGNK